MKCQNIQNTQKVSSDNIYEYETNLYHKDNIKAGEIESADNLKMETYSEDLEIGKKRVKLTLEFPCTTDIADKNRFEHVLKKILVDKARSSLQKGL